MRCIPLPLAGLMLVEAEPRRDERGLFARVFCEQELAQAGFPCRVAQANISRTARQGTVRGLHFQRPPAAEAKIVRCLRGRVLDVAVDLRRGSPTFLKWHAEELSAENMRALAIPEGFAHGFQTLTPDCEILYLHSHPYAPEHEGGLRHDDKRLGISWPLPVTDLSARDAAFPALDESFTGMPLP